MNAEDNKTTGNSKPDNNACWYFDFISPFAYLQWMDLRTQSNIPNLEIKPVLFAGLLKKNGQLGPAEIPAKRAYTYRYVTWLAREQDVPFRFPSGHPFNPLPLLRLALAAQCQVEAVDQMFQFVWCHGHIPSNDSAMDALAERLSIENWRAAIQEPAIKQALIANTEEAIAKQIFGVPTIDYQGQQFWGQDSTEMFLDFLRNPELFDDAEMQRVSELPIAVERPR